MPVETRNVCVISTAHLTPETVTVLSGPRSGWPVHGGALGPDQPDGFLVHVGEPCGEHPRDLAGCFAWAKRFNPPFDYIMFDCDADAIGSLPVFGD